MKEALVNLAGRLFPNLFRNAPAPRLPGLPFPYLVGYKHIQAFRNTTPGRLRVSFGPYGQLYLLKPADEMTIIYDQDPDCPGLGLSTFVYDDGLMICPQEPDEVIVLINGNLVESV
jgi:hypothetical protein